MRAGSRVAGYELLHPLGEGGMGAVYALGALLLRVASGRQPAFGGSSAFSGATPPRAAASPLHGDIGFRVARDAR